MAASPATFWAMSWRMVKVVTTRLGAAQPGAAFLPNMDLKQLEYFVRVAELGSFTRAAIALDIAQPALSRQVRLLEVELRRPDRRNALDRAAQVELDEVFDAFVADPDLRAAVIHGAGDDFCVGVDLDQVSWASTLVTPTNGFAGLTARELTKPVIAAVSGAAHDAGLELMLACHLAVADETASFALTQTTRGLVAEHDDRFLAAARLRMQQRMGDERRATDVQQRLRHPVAAGQPRAAAGRENYGLYNGTHGRGILIRAGSAGRYCANSSVGCHLHVTFPAWPTHPIPRGGEPRRAQRPRLLPTGSNATPSRSSSA